MGLLEIIANAASAAYKRTAVKVGAVLLAGNIFAGCVNDYFTSIIPPQEWQAQTTFESEGWGIRGKLKSDKNPGNSAGFSYKKDETEIAGNTATEERTVFDAKFKPSRRRSFTVSPRIELLENKVVTPAGVQESHTTGFSLASDLGFGNLRQGSNFLLVRPHFTTEDTGSVAGDLTTTQSGVYARGKYGLFRPLISLEFYDFGAGVPKASEVQLGTSAVLGGNEEFSVGYFLSLLDDGTDQSAKHILLGDASIMSGGRNFLGVDGCYDGSLFGAGLHGAYSKRGGNMPQNAKRFREAIRKLQDLTFLERGLPVSTAKNMRTDAAQALQGVRDANLFYLLGVRQEYDASKDKNVLKPYAMVGTNVKDVTFGATCGNVFEVYPADSINGRGGVFSGVKLGEGRLNVAWERIDFENRKDMSALSVYFRIPSD